MRVLFRHYLVLLLLLVVQGTDAYPNHAFVSIAFDQPQATIGRTLQLYIGISNPAAQSIHATHFECVAEGGVLTLASLGQQPDIINANSLFETTQFYTADIPGSTDIHCVLDAVDTSTGETFSVNSPTLTVEVSPETRLYIEVSSTADVAIVQETVFLTVTVGNRGETTFTNVVVSCPQLGRSLVFIGSTQAPNDLLPGTDSVLEYQLQAVRSGVGYFVCSITATDDTNTEITLLTPPVVIEVQ
jgi:uncharacterized repeat protein (TIGR01451 family)